MSVVLNDDLGVSMLVSMDLGPRLGLCLDLILARACGEFRVFLRAKGQETWQVDLVWKVDLLVTLMLLSEK